METAQEKLYGHRVALPQVASACFSPGRDLLPSFWPRKNA